ncbi:unnamed protein product [Cylicocyclus nassatus]|uniref:Uncharacterized protein n=1 Tax=Cylicocyclus nassatus TaxID=53992 RepID=A0AA36DNS8_CYLNA|nr:unnamed protein product [Cylicocyclus nassatus]
MRYSGHARICVHLLFITQHYLVPVLCAESRLGYKLNLAKATSDNVPSLEAALQAEHDVSKTLNASDMEEETDLNSPASAEVTKTIGQLEQHTTLLPSQKDIQARTEKRFTLRSAKGTIAASTRKKSIAVAKPTTMSGAEEFTASASQAEKEAKAATSAVVAGAATEKKQDQQDDVTEEPDNGEEPEDHIKDTKIPMDARSTVTSHLDEKLYATISTTRSSISDEDDDTEKVSPDSVRNLESPDAKGQSGFYKKKANVGAVVLLVCGIILSLLLSILVVLISMMISAQKTPRLRSTTQSAAASSAKV